jgi:hypothetical protein
VKLFDWLRPKLRVPEARDEPHPRTREELILAARLSRANDGAPFGTDEWAALDRMLAAGREAEAIDILRRFIAAQPQDLDATMRLSELLCGRLEHALARPLLQRLTASPPHRIRSLLLLAEGAERAGELDAARAAYEQILAVDLGHARARAAAERLRPAGAMPSSAHAPATLDGPAGVATPVGGRYQLRAELGRGASGTVYLADDVALDRPIALKILHPRSRTADGTARLRAWEEARVSAAISHPGVVAIYDLDEERQLIAMELCQGGSLKERLARGPLAPREALFALQQLCSTLAAAHERGVVHGDVKPANLLLRRALDAGATLDEDDLVLCDFGIARAFGEAAGDATATSPKARGTLAYMAPEQRRGVLEPPADLYAAGVVGIELFSGPAALASLVGDRAALLRGALRLDAALPEGARAALGNAADAVAAIFVELLAEDAARRPRAADAAARLRAILATA